jgi:hypothetical protein
MRYFSKITGLVATLAFAAMCAGLALADGSSALKDALVATMKLTTYHMTMTSPQGVVEADVINPGRMHVKMKDGEMIVVDKTMYMKQAGVWTKYPGVDVMQTQTDPLKAFAAKAADYQVDDLGMKLVDGATLHAYRTTNLKKKYLAMMYIDGSGRIVRLETGTMVMVMSKFGEAVTIVAPM